MTTQFSGSKILDFICQVSQNRPAPLYAQASLLGGQEARLTAGVEFEPCREGRRAPAHISARWAARGQFSTAAHLQLNPQKLSLQTRSEDRKLAPTLWRVLSPVHWVPTCSKHCKHCKGSIFFSHVILQWRFQATQWKRQCLSRIYVVFDICLLLWQNLTNEQNQTKKIYQTNKS